MRARRPGFARAARAVLAAATLAAALALTGCVAGGGTDTAATRSLPAATPASTWVTGTPGAATPATEPPIAPQAGTPSGTATETAPRVTPSQAPGAATATPAPAARSGGPGMPGGMGMMAPGTTAPAPTSTPPAVTQAAPAAPADPAAPTAPAAGTPIVTAPAPTSAQIYQQECAVCHGVSRQGGRGPALLPSTLTGDPSYFVSVVEHGVVGTQMPGWLGHGLTAAQIQALVDYLRTTP